MPERANIHVTSTRSATEPERKIAQALIALARAQLEAEAEQTGRDVSSDRTSDASE